MSLDIYLKADKPFKRPPSSGIFIRENGQTKEISRQEWDRINPFIKPVVAVKNDEEETDVLYHGNITHNLARMAEHAGVYMHLWRPHQVNATKAEHLIDPLRTGLAALKKNPTHFKRYNPQNGWGSYDVFVRFVDECLTACKAYPQAKVEVCA